MVRLAVAALAVLAAACDTEPRRAFDAPVVVDSPQADSPQADAWEPPAPSSDAGPPPAMSCGGDASATCAIPPSTCLDEYYLIYYTDPVCDAGTCRYTTNLLQCTCVAGGCDPGFT